MFLSNVSQISPLTQQLTHFDLLNVSWVKGQTTLSESFNYKKGFTTKKKLKKKNLTASSLIPIDQF